MYKYVYALIILMTCLVFHCENILSWLEPSPRPNNQVNLYTNKLHYDINDTLIITLENNSASPLFLAGCSPFYMADKCDTGWVVSPFYLCVWEGFAKKIAPGKRYQEEHSLHNYAGIHKIHTTVYWQCKESNPVSQAECKSQDSIFSCEFTVTQNDQTMRGYHDTANIE